MQAWVGSQGKRGGGGSQVSQKRRDPGAPGPRTPLTHPERFWVLFRNEVYCDLFLKILERVRRRYRLVVLGYVVMPEHVHLLVSEPQRETLSTAVQAFKLGLVRSLQGSGGSGVAAAPRSRKNGETWGTLKSSFEG